MVVGIPKEILPDESRIALLPAGVEELTRHGHRVLVENDAGLGSRAGNQDYVQAGAEIVDTAEAVYRQSDLIVKVKEPQPEEWDWLSSGQSVFGFFHFAAYPQLLSDMIQRGVTCITYETVQDDLGRLPLLTPMSEIGGRMAIQEGAKYLERPFHGRGILLGGVPGVMPAQVLILGAGVVGSNAAKMAAGLGAHVELLDINLSRLRYLDDVLPANVTTLMSSRHTIRDRLSSADLVVCSALIRGAKTPKLITQDMLTLMRPGSVIVDVAIDQGGSTETSRSTTHQEPTYVIDGVVHYCVANIPGAVGGTSTPALTNATTPYVVALADLGPQEALRQNPVLARGLNVHAGHVTLDVLRDMGPYRPLQDALNNWL